MIPLKMNEGNFDGSGGDEVGAALILFNSMVFDNLNF